ncbi:MAG TPA: hypothetical protein VKT24_07685 [Rhizomicrobium sp.]|nr:hypothetical protein [Rhizomicrobium sp.]
MAKSKGVPAVAHDDVKYDKWNVRDAMHTMMRAGELTKDKKMMGLVRKEAARHAAEMAEVAHKASMLAKAGRISEKAMAKHIKKGQGGNTKGLEKTNAIA